MTITHEQAVELVRQKFEPGWTRGTFCIDDREIMENDDMYVVGVGPREYLVDGDRSYEAVGAPAVVVHKKDGTVAALPSVQVATDPSFTIRPNPSPTLEV